MVILGGPSSRSDFPMKFKRRAANKLAPAGPNRGPGRAKVRPADRLPHWALTVKLPRRRLKSGGGGRPAGRGDRTPPRLGPIVRDSELEEKSRALSGWASRWERWHAAGR